MPLYSDGVLDEVRNSVNIVSLVSEYVALKKQGRNFVARCPFHTEKTPSFNVNEDKQIFMCFGCHVGGDVFKFVMLVEHLSFPEAVRHIAERNGITLPEDSAPNREAAGDTDNLRRAMSEACSFFRRMLLESEEGRAALKYLDGRGVTRGTIDKFAMGYAPADGKSLMQALLKLGIPAGVLQECGLTKLSEDGSRQYDVFRGRVMFPITDVRGRVIAFGGRAMADRQPKYLNSPETRLYNKSRNLFGLYFSREGIKRLDFAVLVEGYMDFIVPFQYGIENLVASLGTSLTPQQVQLLGRYTREVVVSYDPDSAGLAATQRSLDLFLEEDFRVRVLRLPDGLDPDEFIRKSGAAGYRDRLRASVPYLDFVLDAAIRSQGSLDNPRNKIQVINAVLPYLAKLPNAVERSDYVFRFARTLRIEDQQLLAEVKRAAQQKRTRLTEAPLASIGVMKFAEKRLLQVLLSNTSLQPEILPLCAAEVFEGLVTEKIFAVILEEHRNNRICTFDLLQSRFADSPEQVLAARLQMEEVPEDQSREAAESFYSALRALRLAHDKQQILRDIDEAARRNDDEELDRLYEERVRVDRELISLSRK
jgi:DNA primase